MIKRGNKKGFELAISTMVLLILGVFILIVFVLAITGSFQKFWDSIKGYSASDIDNLQKLCQSQCDLENKYSHCCELKNLGKEKVTCLDKRIDVSCVINCENIC